MDCFTLKPISGKGFVDRKELVRDMFLDFKDIKTNVGYALYGVRKIGKTSILRELERVLNKEKKVVVVYMSVWDLADNSIKKFSELLIRKVLSAYNKKLKLNYDFDDLLSIDNPQTLRKIFENIGFGIKIYDMIEFVFRIGENKKDYKNIIDNAFKIPESIAKEINTKCVLMIDEFPSIMELQNGKQVGINMIRHLRTLCEEQKNVALCISGSFKHTMDAVCISKISPFFKQLIIKEVKPLDFKYTKQLFMTCIDCEVSSEAMEEIFAITKGVPYYIQYLGKFLSRKYKVINEKNVRTEYNNILKEYGEVLFNGDFRHSSSKERKILLAMARKGLVRPSNIAREVGEKENSVSVFLLNLQHKAVIEKIEKVKKVKDKKILYSEYVIQDPFFHDWLKTTNIYSYY